MMEERERRWKELEAEIKCPFKPDLCKKDEGVKRYEQFISHNAVVITAECNFCSKQASAWGQR